MRVLIPVAATAAALALMSGSAPRPAVSSARCSMIASGQSIVGPVVDTAHHALRSTQRVAPSRRVFPIGSTDTAWTPDTPMPTAAVRAVAMDSATREQLAAAGITTDTPRVLIQVVPYQSDCSTIAWTDSSPWAVPTAEAQYFANIRLRPRELWIDGTPTFVLAGGWDAPYPRRLTSVPITIRSWAAGTEGLRPPLTRDSMVGALELFAFHRALRGSRDVAEHLAWAEAHPAVALREPVRSHITDLVLREDFARAARMRSEYAGSYRLEVSSGALNAAWTFRTLANPLQSQMKWNREVAFQRLSEVPKIPGYTLPGYSPDSAGRLPETRPSPRSGPGGLPRHWLSLRDPITTPVSSPRTIVAGELIFALGAAPEALWDVLARFPVPADPHDMVFTSARATPRGDTRVHVPLTLRLDATGSFVADTTLTRGGSAVRFRLVRMDGEALR